MRRSPHSLLRINARPGRCEPLREARSLIVIKAVDLGEDTESVMLSAQHAQQHFTSAMYRADQRWLWRY